MYQGFSRKAKFLASSLLAFVASASAQSDPNVGPPSEVLGGAVRSAVEYSQEMLMIPDLANQGQVLLWIGGFVFTIYAFRLAVDNFDTKMGNWISSSGGATRASTSREYWIISLTLTLIFIGGTKFLDWINELLTLMVVSAGLLLLAIAIRSIWFSGSVVGGSLWSVGNDFGGSLLSAGNDVRTGSIGRFARSTADAAQSYWGSGGKVDNAYSQYKNIPRCNGSGKHLNPQDPPSGASPPYSCWVNGCGGDWS